LWQDKVYGFQLSDTERAPASTKKTDHQSALGQQIARRNQLAVVICEFKRRRLCTCREGASGHPRLLEIGDYSGMDSLRFRRNVFGNEFLALGKNLAQRPCIRVRTRFFEGAPFHRVDGG
jgi:hypothetical protein